MKAAITITPPDAAARESRLIVRFTYPDPAIALKADQEVVSSIMDEALQRAITTPSVPPLVFQINRPTTLSRTEFPRNAWKSFTGGVSRLLS
jgi:hypothetical protein